MGGRHHRRGPGSAWSIGCNRVTVEQTGRTRISRRSTRESVATSSTHSPISIPSTAAQDKDLADRTRRRVALPASGFHIHDENPIQFARHEYPPQTPAKPSAVRQQEQHRCGAVGHFWLDAVDRPKSGRRSRSQSARLARVSAASTTTGVRIISYNLKFCLIRSPSRWTPCPISSQTSYRLLGLARTNRARTNSASRCSGDSTVTTKRLYRTRRPTTSTCSA